MKSRLFSLLEPVAADLGYELFEVEFGSAGRDSLVRAFIDRTDGGGVTLDDCERGSRAIAAVLAAEDPIGHEYRLEVSSPGLDRPLRGEADYRRFTGRLAKIVTTAPVGGQTHFMGRLAGVEAGEVLVAEGKRVHRVPIDAITRARLEVEF